MAELPDIVQWGLVGAVVLLLFAFAWSAMAAMPPLVRRIARVCLTLVAVLPLVLLALFSELGLPKMAGSPPMAERPPVAAEAPEGVSEAEPSVGAPAGKSSAPRYRKNSTAPKSAAPDSEVEVAPSIAEESTPAETVGEAASDTAASEEGVVRSLETAPPSAGSPPPGAGGADQPPPPVVTAPAEEAEKPDSGFDIVPVYYGTDRDEAPVNDRLDYGANRGRKLTLGQALVTVPKSHVQPTIERPWAIRVPYFDITLYEEAEDPEKHFTMKELKALSREDFLAAVRERLSKSERFKDHALVFVHGYNTTFDNGVYRTAQIAYDLKFDGAPFLYSWPSGGGVASYTYDRESAGQAVPFMRDFFQLVIKETGAKHVSVIAHSMGNQPTLQVLKDIKASSPPGVVISQIILAAPDVDRDNFENIAKEIQGLANGITLYAAANDRALNVSRRFHGGVPRAGDIPETGPVVLTGVDTIDVTAVSTDSFGLNHSGYAENNALLNDLQLLIQTGERPPEKRVPILERIGTAAGAYWRYPRNP